MAWKRLAVAHSCLPSPPHCASQKKSILKTLLILHHEFARNVVQRQSLCLSADRFAFHGEQRKG